MNISDPKNVPLSLMLTSITHFSEGKLNAAFADKAITLLQGKG